MMGVMGGPYTGTQTIGDSPESLYDPGPGPKIYVSSEIVNHLNRDHLTALLGMHLGVNGGEVSQWEDVIYTFISELPKNIDDDTAVRKFTEEFSK